MRGACCCTGVAMRVSVDALSCATFAPERPTSIPTRSVGIHVVSLTGAQPMEVACGPFNSCCVPAACCCCCWRCDVVAVEAPAAAAAAAEEDAPAPPPAPVLAMRLALLLRGPRPPSEEEVAIMEVWSLSDVLLLLLAVCPAFTVHFAACSQVFAAAQPSTTAHNKKCGLLLGAHLTGCHKTQPPLHYRHTHRHGGGARRPILPGRGAEGGFGRLRRTQCGNGVNGRPSTPFTLTIAKKYTGRC